MHVPTRDGASHDRGLENVRGRVDFEQLRHRRVWGHACVWVGWLAWRWWRTSLRARKMVADEFARAKKLVVWY